MLTLKYLFRQENSMNYPLNKKILLGILIVVSFLFIVFNVSQYISFAGTDQICDVQGFCPHETQLNFIKSAVPLLAAVSVLIGAGVYYFMSSKVEVKEKSLKKNTDVFLRFLSPDEKKVVDKLIEGHGKVLQAELTRLPGLNKVKSHRIVQKLIDRGVIKIEKLGKTNVVEFPQEIKEGML